MDVRTGAGEHVRELLERESELAAINAALDNARGGRGSVVLIEGPAGIGKSSLLAAAVAGAEDRRFTLASARAGELERDFVWGVVRQLLEPAFHDNGAAELLSGAAQPARRVFDPDAAAPDAGAFPVIHGLYWMVQAMTGRAPLLLVVDDAQWADHASIRWLTYLAPRVVELPLVVMLATRPLPPEEITRVAADPATIRPVPLPLSVDAVGDLVRAGLGDAVDAGFSEACHNATGGNPFLVHELVAALGAEGTLPTAEHASRVRELRPDAISRAVLMRLSALSPDARELARAVAVLDRRAKIRHAAALAELEPHQTEAALHALLEAEVLADGTPLAFVHPIVRSVVYDDLSSAQMDRLHARAAAALSGEGAPPEAIAPHLLRVEPATDAWTRNVLAAAAADARAGAAPALAAEYLRRALQEAPPDDERATLLFDLAQCEFDARGSEAVSAFQAALDAADDPRLYGQIALSYGRSLHVVGNHPESARVYDRAFAKLGETDSDLARTLEAEAIIAAVQDRATVDIAQEGLPAAAARLGAGGAPDAMVAAALTLVTCGFGDPSAVAQAKAVIASGDLDGAEQMQAFAFACFVLACADELGELTRLWETRVDEYRRQAALPALSFACCFAAQAALLRGDPAKAEAFARESLEVSPADWALTPPDPTCFLIDALVELGELDKAEAELEALDYDESMPERQGYSTLLMSRARLRLARDRLDEGVADLEELGRRMDSWGLLNPAAYPWRSTLATAIAATDPARARELAQTELERATAWGAARPLGVALRGAGLVARSEGLDQLRESVAVLQRSPARLEHARSVAALGSALRRANQRTEALDVLRDALDRASALGAIALAAHVRGELVAAGARPRRDAMRGRDALTASERRIAELAAGGLTNRQIAEKLFLTLSTVERHLTHVYRKLDVSSRDALAKTLG